MLYSTSWSILCHSFYPNNISSLISHLWFFYPCMDLGSERTWDLWTNLITVLPLLKTYYEKIHPTTTTNIKSPLTFLVLFWKCCNVIRFSPFIVVEILGLGAKFNLRFSCTKIMLCKNCAEPFKHVRYPGIDPV